MAKKKMGAPLRLMESTGEPARDRIINLRRALNLSQAGLAEKLGTTRTTVASWEQGLSRPSGIAEKILTQLEKKKSAGGL